MAEYLDIETDHEYDGIKEFDNRLPAWWLFTLWIMVAFGFAYWIWFQTLGAPDSFERYDAELKEFNAKLLEQSIDPAELVAMASDSAAIEAGKEVYKGNCATCHGPNAEGKVGPNLTDKFWKNGGSTKEIFVTVAGGVNATTMQAWLPVLGRTRVNQVTAYVLSIRNSNAAGGKAPEGKEYVATP